MTHGEENPEKLLFLISTYLWRETCPKCNGVCKCKLNYLGFKALHDEGAHIFI